MAALSLGPTPTRRTQLTRRIRLLVAATITYNVIEAIVAITSGTLASSTALIGFGLDSVVEVSSAAAVAWQFSAADHTVREAREKTALRKGVTTGQARPWTSRGRLDCSEPRRGGGLGG